MKTLDCQHGEALIAGVDHKAGIACHSGIGYSSFLEHFFLSPPSLCYRLLSKESSAGGKIKGPSSVPSGWMVKKKKNVLSEEVIWKSLS
ncbi:hypothetical protein CEXT_252121 [Caerostris extrusa]|uniref:Uncharacterized protein n=1 Tax=Caerostris extrusa TaxID=172846 RepID=A0AAV4Y7D5_CAEEX|nr:hypothetical protein CEXT_252121 [Caerostris extrusa]